MKKKISLNGKWDLYYYLNDSEFIDSREDLENKDAEKIDAIVPGNVELDLARAGIIDSDLFKGMATEKNEKWERYDWWYEKTFLLDEDIKNRKVFLSFGAVDCFADYFVNGEYVYSSENAFKEIRFDVTDKIKRGQNCIRVHIKSSIKYALAQKYNMYLSTWRFGEQSYVRKPAHAFGWDIMPRAVTAGLWRDVFVEIDDGYSFEEFGYYLSRFEGKIANLRFPAVVNIPYSDYGRNIQVHVRGVCGDSEFDGIGTIRRFKGTVVSVKIENPKLWWPYGYGEPSVYDVTYELLVDNEVKDSGRINVGIRTVELVRTEDLTDKNHSFKFVINGVDIMCVGSNWIPLDAYHSRDKSRYQKALELFTDTHCNILRVWGGGVYEQEEFYDYCDRHGIMVWQDFMMACIQPALNKRTLDNIRDEAEWAVKKLRNHPSIILWSGDNEIDIENASSARRPGFNKATREVLKTVVEHNDLGRPYIESSPYVPDSSFMSYFNKENIFVEQHLWGPRDYYKADYYSQSRAHFISETGYHGCPCLESLKKIVDEDFIWPIFNEQWTLHSSDQKGYMQRVELMSRQIKQIFDFEPDNIGDFVLASQISQAEAKKYFIERVRIKRPYTTGVIWWNMLDGWPQMSDAVVDYFFEKKLAYHYIKRVQNPFVIMMNEMNNWGYDIVASNDTLENISGEYKIYDIDTKEVLSNGEFNICPNSNLKLGKIDMMYPEKHFLIIEWITDGKKYYNHYLCGMPAFDFNKYKGWIENFNNIMKKNGVLS